MEIAKIRVKGAEAIPEGKKKIPQGIVGATVRFVYADPIWDSLDKTVVFQSYIANHAQPSAAVVVLHGEEVLRFPAEVVARAGHYVSVGVFGTDAEGNQIIPTLWAELGKVQEATDPSGDESTDPELPVWAQLEARVGALEENGTGGGLSITSDGEGNVAITTSGAAGITSDGNGNVTIA